MSSLFCTVGWIFLYTVLVGMAIGSVVVLIFVLRFALQEMKKTKEDL